MKINRWSVLLLTRVGLLVVAGCVSMTGLSWADTPAAGRKYVDIPAESLEVALQALANGRKFQLIYVTEEINKLRTPGAKGMLTVEETLRQLLRGTGMSFKYLDANTITVFPIPASASPSRAAPRSSNTTGETDHQPERLDEVVVTAQRSAEPILSVPIAISALTRDTLQDMGAVDFEDYARAVPGLSYAYVGPIGYHGDRELALRGVYGYNTVGFYIDEASVPVLDPKLLDIDRIEILRGPQATAYGSGSVGGTIRVITVQPELRDFGGDVRGDVGYTDGGTAPGNRFSATLNIPLITDSVALRMTWGRIQNSGFIDNYWDPIPWLTPTTTPPANTSNPPYGRSRSGEAKAWNDELAQVARAALRIVPIEHLVITPSVYNTSDRIGANEYYYNGLPGLSIQKFVPTPEEERFTLTNLTVTYAWDFLQILSTSSNFVHAYRGDDDATQFFPLRLYQTPTPVTLWSYTGSHTFTQEVRALTSFNTRLNALVGVVYQRVHDFGGETGPIAGLSAYNPQLPPVSGDTLYTGSTDSLSDERDAYAELRYRVSPGVKLKFGARYYQFAIRQTLDSYGLLTLTPYDHRERESGTRPEASISWQPAKDLLLYATYGAGFRPGGVNTSLPPTCPQASQTYHSDNVASYELGDKSSLWNHRLDTTLSLYDMKWYGIQQSVVLPCGVFVTANSGTATSRGVEFEGQASLTGGLSLDLTLTYANTRIDSIDPSTAFYVGGSAGDPLLRVPKWKTGLSVKYERPLTERWQGYGYLDYEYSSREWFLYSSEAGQKRLVRGGYGTAGVHLGARSGPWRLELYGTNLGNVHPVTNLLAAPLVPEYSTIRPRTVGMDAAYRF